MSLRAVTIRTRAVFGIAFAELRRSPSRTVLMVLAVTLAVLSVTLLASLGVGVMHAGEDGLDGVDRDIWISSDPVDRHASGTENPIVGAHTVAGDVTTHEDVRSAAPIAMHEIYVATDSGDPERTSAVGVHQTHDGFGFEAGGGFDTEMNHTAEGYEVARTDEPITEEVVLDPNTAATVGVSVGDTVYVGGSRETVREHEFTVVGIAPYYSQFLGTDVEAVPLLDLQAIAGTAGTDRATFITVSVEDGADREAVTRELDAEYEAYDVRTSDDQVRAMFEERPIVLASGATLVGLAVLGGTVLTVNLFALVTYQQRFELAALRALGLSRWTLAGTIGAQGLTIGVAGGVVALAATPPLVAGLNRLAESIVGLEGLVSTPIEVYVAGLVLAILVGTVVAIIAGWRAGRYARIEHLES